MNIHKRLKQEDGEDVGDNCAVTRWVKQISDGPEESCESDLCSRARSGTPSSDLNFVSIDWAVAKI